MDWNYQNLSEGIRSLINTFETNPSPEMSRAYNFYFNGEQRPLTREAIPLLVIDHNFTHHPTSFGVSETQRDLMIEYIKGTPEQRSEFYSIANNVLSSRKR